MTQGLCYEMKRSQHTMGMERRLAAIFSADVQGYSRLMGEDEESTIRTLTAYRSMMSRLIQEYRGRVVDAPGDNLLAEFVSVVDAVQCAVAVQRTLAACNNDLPSHRRMTYRIGINLGDVVVEQEQLYGDDVNIAARLERLAVGGGVCISGTVYDQVMAKLDLDYVFLGEHIVKNIARPVRVYRVAIGTETTSPLPVRQWREHLSPRQRLLWGALAILMLLAVALLIWYGTGHSLEWRDAQLVAAATASA